MEYANATVRIGGSLLHTVDKVGLTVPEVIVLRMVHGSDAVVNLKYCPLKDAPYGKKHKDDEEYREYSDIDEMERLINTYGEEVVVAGFPGHSPNFPKTFKDIGIELEGKPVRKRETASKGGTRKPQPEQIGEDPAGRDDSEEWFGDAATA